MHSESLKYSNAPLKTFILSSSRSPKLTLKLLLVKMKIRLRMLHVECLENGKWMNRDEHISGAIMHLIWYLEQVILWFLE
mmetsp:Transcript_3126/g.7537  ORF Transcript_3126/g.7537 Transcript_3126/m.7537 type:complete len:80 (+) Transcript_3126:545-784(+)